jgi:hypothetical protein
VIRIAVTEPIQIDCRARGAQTSIEACRRG